MAQLGENRSGSKLKDMGVDGDRRVHHAESTM